MNSIFRRYHENQIKLLVMWTLYYFRMRFPRSKLNCNGLIKGTLIKIYAYNT